MTIKNLKFQINGGAVSVCSWASASGVSSAIVTALSHGDFVFSIAFNGGFYKMQLWLCGWSVVDVIIAETVMDSKVGSHCDIFSCLVAACLLCGEEQEDVNTAVCLHNLGRIRLFFSLEEQIRLFSKVWNYQSLSKFHRTAFVTVLFRSWCSLYFLS